MSLITLIRPCSVLGQTPNENDTIGMDFVIVESDDDTDNETGNDVDVNALVDEFKSIMAIPKNERTVEQWDRALEILFLIYSNADLRDLFYELQAELEKYTELTSKLDDMLANLDEVYESELASYNRLNELYNGLSELYQNYSKPYRQSLIFACGGYTIGTGLSVGLGIAVPIGFISIGGYVGYISNFKDINLFSINFLIGFSF